MTSESRQSYEFGPFMIDTANRLLLRDGKPVPLTPKVVDTLLLLIERSGDVVTKQEMMDRLWPNTFVDEANLTQNVYTLRKTLGDGYIETIPRRGYRFTGELHVGTDSQPARRRPRAAIAIAALLVIVLVIALAVVATRWLTTASPHISSLAVLPLQPLVRTDADARLGTGMADAVITRLDNLRQLAVRPTSAVVKYANGVSPVKAGRELAVDAVLSGTMQRAGDRMRVTMQLVDVHSGSSIWGAKFDERYTDIFTLQDSISERVAQALALELSPDVKRRIEKHATENTDAYEQYLLGSYYSAMFNREGFAKALDAFARAIAIDRQYSAAYSGIANCHLWLATDYAQPLGEGEKARAAALAALQRDPDLADAHAALGMVKWRFDFDWPGAEREFKRAVDLDPGSPANHHKYGWYLALLGRVDESKKEMAEARRLDPMSLPVIVDEGLPFYVARDFAGAYRLSSQSVEMNPRFSMGYYDLGLTYAAKRDWPNAIRSFQKAIPLDDDPENVAGLGYAYAAAGQPDEAKKVLTQLDALSKQRYVSPGSVALIYAALGDRDQAFQWFDKAFADRSWTLLFAKVDPRFDPLRTDPRFATLLKRIGLAVVLRVTSND